MYKLGNQISKKVKVLGYPVFFKCCPDDFRYMAPPPPPYDPYGGYSLPPVPMPAPPAPPVHVAAPNSYMPVQNTKDNPPCNTLFIGNLGENINEEELRGLLSVQPGFKQMKVLRQERHTVCFIEFEILVWTQLQQNCNLAI